MNIRFLAIFGVAALTALAQDPAPAPQTSGRVQVIRSAGGGDVMYFGAEMAGSPKMVKGAPYSAQTVSEHTQVLADGNTISQKQTGAVYRDSEGRTRREQTLGQIGPVPAGATPIQLVFINDPVAGVSYVLDVNRKTAQKVPLPPAGGPQAGAIATMSLSSAPTWVSAQASQVVVGARGEPPAQESLGSKTIEGVQADGSRIATTIPAGQMGNERPIEIVTERWFSPQLQATVLTTTNDPRMGQSAYRLEDVILAEPDPSLFQVPADYTITDGPARMNVMPGPRTK